jgi:hypothetical protein
MSAKKVQSILSLIEIIESNLKTARILLTQLADEKGISTTTSSTRPASTKSVDEAEALEVVEGYFDGQQMIGDNGQVYIVPANYASKTQLVVGDRLKWILTPEREIYKPILLAPRERVIGTFTVEGDDFVVLVDKLAKPVKILKASATYAIKNLGLQIGDEVSITIPKEATPTWGAFGSVVKSTNKDKTVTALPTTEAPNELDNLEEFKLSSSDNLNDYF